MKQMLLSILCTTALLLAHPSQAQDTPRLDVAFLLDATGSMGDEIDAVKDKIRDMISTIALGDPAPAVRFGIVAYRDRGDTYVTTIYPLTDNIDEIVDNLDRIEADGGGDYAESLTEALHATVHDLNWDMEAKVSRLVFLIADAPPHLDYPDDYDYVEEYQMAQEKGIAVHAIGASGLDEEGERIFNEIAAGTGGQFQWLAYESRYVDEDGDEVIVIVEGRTATYSKGDSTWTVEGDGGFSVDGDTAVRTSIDEEDAEMGAPTSDGSKAETSGAASAVETSTNLADLITETVRDAAAEQGVEYNDDATSVQSTTWGQIKKQAR